jgi:hypothetical protein
MKADVIQLFKAPLEKRFTTADRGLIRAAAQAWSFCLREQTEIFDFTDEGEEYCVVIDNLADSARCHLGFTATGFFHDSQWFGYTEASTLMALLLINMPKNVSDEFNNRKANA